MAKSKWIAWSGRLFTYACFQLVLLGISTICGFLIVRSADKENYAWFTIVNSLIATIGVLSDSGISSAMMSIGGRVCDDRAKFASLIASAQRIQMRLVLLATTATLPFGAWLLSRNGAPWQSIIILLSFTVLAAFAAVHAVVLNTANKLHGRMTSMLKADVSLVFTRLTFIAGGVWFGLTASLATFATAAAQWINLEVLRRQVKQELANEVTFAYDCNNEICGHVWSLFPLTLFNCVQAHITTWILSFFANAHEVADVGALSRLGIIFSFLTLPLTQLVIPVIARARTQRRLLQLCTGFLTAVSVSAALIVIAGVIFSTETLGILGKEYSHLNAELILFLSAQALSVVVNCAWGVATARGWVRHSWGMIPMTIACQAFAIMWLDLSQVTHTIIFAAIPNVIGLVITLALIARGITSYNGVLEEPASSTV